MKTVRERVVELLPKGYALDDFYEHEHWVYREKDLITKVEKDKFGGKIVYRYFKNGTDAIYFSTKEGEKDSSLLKKINKVISELEKFECL